MKSLKYVLAIDLGTSGPKVALVSSIGEIIGQEVEKTALNVFDGGGAEQSPDDWWAASMLATKRLLDKGLVARTDVVAIACTGQWAGTVALDKNGKHLMDAMIWFDSRGASCIDEIIAGFPKISGYAFPKLRKWIKLTGGAPSRSGKDPIAHILYIQKHFPEIYKKTHKFLEPKDYLNYKLTGKMVSTYDTMALHWVTDNRDINNINYNEGLLKMSGLERKKLPDMINSTDVVGFITAEIAEELGLNPDVKVVGGTPDVQSALIGSGTVRDYEVNLCVGTSSFISCHVPYKKIDLLHNIASIPSGIPGRYFIANDQETAAVCLSFLKDNLFFPDDELSTSIPDEDIYRIFDKMVAKTAVGSNNLIFTPWLYGERSPIDDHHVRGGFYNMSLETTRRQMVRAVYEGVAYNSRWLFMYIEKFISKKLEHINIIGGGAKSAVWCQIFADVLGCKVRQVKNPRQANAKGAAMLALQGLGYATFQEVADKTAFTNIFEPNLENKKIYDKLFNEFVTIYKNNKQTYYRLNHQSL